MSNVILYGRNRNLEDHTIKLNDSSGHWSLGVGNTGFAIGYRYWEYTSIQIGVEQTMLR